jgi:hypothetical protein
MNIATTVAQHREFQAFFIRNDEFTELFLIFCEKSFILAAIFLSALLYLLLEAIFKLIYLLFQLHISPFVILQLILRTMAISLRFSYFCIHFTDNLFELFVLFKYLPGNFLNLITFFIKFTNLFD